MAHDDSHGDEYHPRDALGRALEASLIVGTGGAFVAAIQNSLSKQNHGAMGFITKSGAHMAVFAGVGGVYEFTKNASANLRQKDDVWNVAIGGYLGGSGLGLRHRSLPKMIGFGALTAVVMSAFTLTGGKLSGAEKEPAVDEYERKLALRKNRRKPVEDTITEIGEGRGVFGPGYAERRAAVLKEKYGVEVPQGSIVS